MTSQKILIIDDSKVIRMQVKEMLPKGNIEVLEASDGIEGLELMHREFPTLVLLDFFMPRMNGGEVVQTIQAHPKLKTLPVVLMSGRREEVEQQIPDLMEHFEFVGKPFEQPVLVKAIKSAMAKAKSRQTSSTPQNAPSKLPAVAPDAGVNALIQSLQSEVRGLRQENTVLRTEVDGLKKQVNQILMFIRQRMK